MKKSALGVLDHYRDQLGGFFGLIEVAARDYILVAGLDPARDEHILRYESPVEITRAPGFSFAQFNSQNLAAYRVDYTSQLPATLKSYHLVVEVSSEVAIDTIYLSTNAEANLAQQLSTDLSFVADELKRHHASPLEKHRVKYLEVEAQTAIRATSELLRRRRWEASAAGQKLASRRLENVLRISHVATSGEAKVLPDGSSVASVLQHPSITHATLAAASQEITSSQLGTSLSRSLDPPSASSHSYWRRTIEPRIRPTQVIINARMILRDASENRPSRVWAYVLAMAGLAWLVACVLANGPWPATLITEDPEDADALLAILLLIPMALYGRLDLGKHGSIAARLRRSSQAVGIASVLGFAATAAAISAGASGSALNLFFGISIALPIVIAMIVMPTSAKVSATDLSEIDPAPWIEAGSGTSTKVDMKISSVSGLDSHREPDGGSAL